MKGLLLRLGLARLARPLLGGTGAILVFHRLRPRDPELTFEENHRNSVAPADFLALLDALAADGVPVIPLDDALHHPGPFVCLTFDDGYRDNHDALLPILETRGVPATVYVAPGLVDGDSPLWWYALDEVITREPVLRLPMERDEPVPVADLQAKRGAFEAATRFMLTAAPDARARLLRAISDRHGMDSAALARRHMMDWTMIRRLAASPLIEIGAHTLTHPPLATLDRADAEREMAASRERLQAETGRAVRHLAYPFGTRATTGEREVRAAAELGFSTAVTTRPGNLRRRGSPHRWPRHGIGPADGPAALRLKVAGIRNPLAELRG